MESSVLGYGSSCAYGHHPCSWGGKSIDKYLCFYNESVNLRAFDCIESGSEKAISFQGKDVDYHDFVGILALLIINSTISFIEENNAGNAAAALMARLAPKAKVCLLAYLFLKNLISSCSPIISFFIYLSLENLYSSSIDLIVFTRSYEMESGAKKMLLCWFLETLLVSS